MKIYLWYQSEVKFGGWPSYTAHLAIALQLQGCEIVLLRALDCKKVKRLSFGRGLNIYNVPIAIAEAWVKANHSIVVVSAPKLSSITTRLVTNGAALVIHDPTEFRGTHLDEAMHAARKIITIRRSVQARLAERGIESQFIPHPYQSVGVGAKEPHQRLWDNRQWHAVGISRIDFDKRTHVICEANEHLPVEKQVQLFGFKNRIYVYHNLDNSHPNWQRCYHGEFSSENVHSGFGIAQQARCMVDMSVIKGDGGGTQYTFLEALDAGCALVLNSEWSTGIGDQDVLGPDFGMCHAASDAETLQDVLLELPTPTDTDREEVRSLLTQHDSDVIGHRYLDEAF